jgi:hypothetical protein
LKSGEVLRGDFEYMRDEKVQFDSDELEDLAIDWSDVRASVARRATPIASATRRSSRAPPRCARA